MSKKKEQKKLANAILKAFGGPDKLAQKIVDEFLASMPGSRGRKKILNGIAEIIGSE